VTGFGIGWQIGTMIRELTGLGKALDNLIVPPEIAAKSIRMMASERLGGLRAELEATKARMEGLTKAADDAAKRVQLAIDAKIAKREQAGAQAEQAAPEGDKPVIAANTALDVARQELEIARQKTAEEKKAADATAAAIDAERQRLALAEQYVKEAQHIFNVYKEIGKSAEVTVDVVAAEERVKTLKQQIEDLKKTAEEQNTQVLTAQTSETINAPDGRENLRLEALKKVQDAINGEEGKPIVEDLLFNNLIIQ
jgi:flagellar basal body-associated protein FliL